jgi:hypothetical protein
MDVAVKDSLSCVFAAVHSDVESGYGRVLSPEPLPQPFEQEVDPIALRLPKPEGI